MRNSVQFSEKQVVYNKVIDEKEGILDFKNYRKKI